MRVKNNFVYYNNTVTETLWGVRLGRIRFMVVWKK